MKKIILSTIFSFFTLLMVSAQLTIAETDLVINGSAGDSDLYGYTALSNDGADTLNLRWVRTINSMPTEWKNYFCAVPGECGLPWTDSLSFALPPGMDSGELQCHCEPKEVAGIGEITVRIINNDTEEVMGTVEVTCDAAVVSVNELEEAKIKLFPNPATDYFHLINGNKVDQIVVYNILGREVKFFEEQEDNFFIGDLSKGIYFVKLVDLDTDVIKTLKLKKN